jgi:transposase, IS5 family
MRGQAGFFDIDERLKELSAKGDHLERLSAIVNFELFRPDLVRAVPRSDGTKGGRPPFGHVFMFKVLVLQASHSLSDERTEFLIKDRLSFMRFLGLGLADPGPDANTIWTFREALTRATLGGKPAIEIHFRAYEAALTKAGFLAMGGQIIDASIVPAPKQRNTEGEKAAIKAGQIPEAWAAEPAKLAQKDRDARWTVKWSKAKPAEDGSRRIDLAVPAFGYKNHLGIDRRHGLIRTWTATDAARHDGAHLPNLVSKANTASDVWADTAYRSKTNEKHLADNGLRLRIHRKKPPGRPMPLNTARANGAKSKVRCAVEHVFARTTRPMGLVVRTVGSRPSDREDRTGQPRLQHASRRLAHRTASRHGVKHGPPQARSSPAAERRDRPYARPPPKQAPTRLDGGFLEASNWLSNRVFASYDDIVGHCCDAWNKLADQPWRIMSLGLCEWAHR